MSWSGQDPDAIDWGGTATDGATWDDVLRFIVALGYWDDEMEWRDDAVWRDEPPWPAQSGDQVTWQTQ